MALESEHPGLLVKNVPGKDGSSVLLPCSQDAYDTLHALAMDKGSFLTIFEIDQSIQVSKGVVMGYPRRLPVTLLQRHTQVEEATRCLTNRQRDETRQVVITVRGPLPPMIDLGNWGTFYTRPWVPEPLRCFRCQRFGHHRANCSLPHVCGMCSGAHPTEECLEKYKAKQTISAKCPNCSGKHHAWFPQCPARVRHVDRGREYQVRWVKENQATSAAPAPPGTFVWGSQRVSAPPNPVNATEFPPLPMTAAPPPEVLPVVPSPPIQPTASPTPRSQEGPMLPQDTILLTKDMLCTITKEVARGVAEMILKAMGSPLDISSFDGPISVIAEKVTDKVLRKDKGDPAPPSSVTDNSCRPARPHRVSDSAWTQPHHRPRSRSLGRPAATPPLQKPVLPRPRGMPDSDVFSGIAGDSVALEPPSSSRHVETV